MRKGILIDVKNETVEEVLIEVDSDGTTLQGLYNLIGCTNVECVSIDDKNDIWVDGEGLLSLTDSTKFFQWKGYEQPLCGNGVILGVNEDNGESVDTTLTLEQVKSNVMFLTIQQVRNMF
jgi:hypothetical protein